MRPTTAFTESWPNATSDIEGTSQDQSWVTVTNTFAVVSGKLRATANFAAQTGTCSSEVSSADHVCQLQITAVGQPMEVGPTARASNSVDTFYLHEYRTTGSRRLAKYVSGTRTQLSLVAVTLTAGDYFGIRAAGSTITGSNTQNSDQSTTDTSITSNLRGGVYWFSDTNNHTFTECDNWSIDDEVAASTGNPWNYYAQQSA
jgi:hypothetical protein